MNNILIEQLPEAVEIDFQVIPIETDFRACLRVILAFEDAELTNVEKQMVLLDNLYPEPPDNTEAALRLGVKFLDGGEESDGEESDVTGPRLSSFSQDANYIFAAFRQTHGIDLEAIEHLHWWKFIALFMDLGSDTSFCQLIGLRKRVKSGKATKEEIAMARELGDMFTLAEPDTRTAEEREQEAAFLALVKEGERKREQAQS